PGLACRFCGAPLSHVFVDLGAQPLANSYLEPEDLRKPEPFLPLCVYVCGECFLVQLPEEERPEAIFSDYAYFSSYSESWLRHAEAYAAAMVERFGLGVDHRVIEVASNDGYLLRWFAERGIPVQGIEPAGNVAAAAEAAGIPTLVKFFGEATARELVEVGTRADLLVGNNVLAHVPDLNDFVAGLKLLLGSAGVLTMEFPHLLRLMSEDQFDTIYHEHYSYFSFAAVRKVFAAHGLTLFDVEELPTHGGSLRIYARHDGDSSKPVGEQVADLLAREETAGLSRLETYRSFGDRVRRVKRDFLRFLIQAKEEGRSIAGYGAPAKGNTPLNYCGVRTDFLDFTVDRSPHKQGRFLPGTRVPIHGPDRLRETRPDYVLILPWNLKEEIMEQMADVRSWGGRFVVAIPEVKILA
ncbi:MAG TPA: class I SAM-dependent methyltransferase, partial [Thermoanaerobaculia bacterium]|nr:class I SAM-dependent methyltransferase [Thermoanaerobaculia bacterium]